ncbi:Protease HtpX [uncultured archaeon]|nr:Protease HtpX [uncultured archaeon]
MAMDFYSQISSNKKMTVLLFIAFFILLGVLAGIISYILGGFSIVGGFFLTIFGILIILFAIISYYTCDSIVTMVSGAKEAPPEKFKQLNNIVEELCLASGLPKPRLFVINDTAINAFATGRDPNHSVICVTTGALQFLNREELQGVIAHELSHIRNYDVRTMTIATVLVGIAVLMSDFLLRFALFSKGDSDSKNGQLFIIILVVGIILAILTPIIAQIIQFSISRKREFAADAGSAEITRNPLGLASALEKISKDKEPLEAANKATAHLYISDPLKNTKGMWLKGLFQTHPPIEQRIAALKGMK